MQGIATRIAMGIMLLLIIPTAVWLSGWHWKPGGNEHVLIWLYWVTETVTQPWGIITHIGLCAWFGWWLCLPLKPALMLCVVLSGTLLIGQGIKVVIKNTVQEPRPFVVWLEKTHHIPTREFYTLKRGERLALIKEQLQAQQDIPVWQRNHWQSETGFAFPSGHTMFVAIWALLGIGLLWPRRRIFTLAVLLVWAAGVMGSRLSLGMHWPRDLAAAAVISGFLAILATWLVQRWCGSFTPTAEKEQEIDKRVAGG